MSFQERLEQRMRACGTSLCVGLDPRPESTEGNVEAFLLRVIDETCGVAAAYKPNVAYYEAMGREGWRILERVREAIPEDIPVVLDAKRGDIGETQRYYARACFEVWRADAVTVNPFLGFDSVEPFLAYEGKGVYLLAVTSNPGSADLQTRMVEGRYVFELVQDMALRAPPGSAGLVVGLTNARPEVLARLADLPLLVPGLGAQGGELGRLPAWERKAPVLVNVSRGILYDEPERSFAEKAKSYADRIAGIF
ncbi:MAG TPA: orotidine-5'-phosphate decarboxylase [Verrucomicrobiales bacterium]|nr:orotidine-5'-phosphate decarboxylase [Verrucomicrobiales bacterium]